MIRGMPLMKKLFSQILVTENCWIWTGTKSKTGYGRIWINGMGDTKVHRLIYQIYNKELLSPQELVCHKCDNKYCCNPDHLFVTDYSGNAIDMINKGRGVRGERVGISKLNPEAIKKIRRYRKMGFKVNTLAKRFGVYRSVVSRILSGKLWRHVS